MNGTDLQDIFGVVVLVSVIRLTAKTIKATTVGDPWAGGHAIKHHSHAGVIVLLHILTENEIVVPGPVRQNVLLEI